MAQKNLLEAYKNRISVAESVYAKAHDGETMNNNHKYFVGLISNN